MGQSIMESRTQNARKFHIAMKTVEKYIRMTHVNVEVVRNSKNVVDVIVQDKNHKLCADSRLYAFCFPVFHSRSHLPFALSFLSVFKRRKSKLERKAEKENTRKQRIYKENST